jgi:hypothetical protein
MRIISPFKDYYDHIAYIYGGGDPKIVYERRKRIADEDLQFSSERVLCNANNDKYLNSVSPVKSKGTLCVAGRIFILLHDTETNEVFVHNPKKRDDYVRYGYSIFAKKKREKEYDLTEVNYGATVLSKLAKAPVFLLKETIYNHSAREWTHVIDKNTPILATIGLAPIYPPEQIYQDLAYFITNLMNDSPDMMPTTNQPDKQKIEAHGFDLKKSFRHRKDDNGQG